MVEEDFEDEPQSEAVTNVNDFLDREPSPIGSFGECLRQMIVLSEERIFDDNLFYRSLYGYYLNSQFRFTEDERTEVMELLRDDQWSRRLLDLYRHKKFISVLLEFFYHSLIDINIPDDLEVFEFTLTQCACIIPDRTLLSLSRNMVRMDPDDPMIGMTEPLQRYLHFLRDGRIDQIRYNDLCKGRLFRSNPEALFNDMVSYPREINQACLPLDGVQPFNPLEYVPNNPNPEIIRYICGTDGRYMSYAIFALFTGRYTMRNLKLSPVEVAMCFLDYIIDEDHNIIDFDLERRPEYGYTDETIQLYRDVTDVLIAMGAQPGNLEDLERLNHVFTAQDTREMPYVISGMLPDNDVPQGDLGAQVEEALSILRDALEPILDEPALKNITADYLRYIDDVLWTQRVDEYQQLLATYRGENGETYTERADTMMSLLADKDTTLIWAIKRRERERAQQGNFCSMM